MITTAELMTYIEELGEDPSRVLSVTFTPARLDVVVLASGPNRTYIDEKGRRCTRSEVHTHPGMPSGGAK